MTTYIHEHEHWPKFIWNHEKISPLLASVRHRQGHLLGSMSNLGFAIQEESNLITLTQDIVKSSAIEGSILKLDEVRSSIARRMGLSIGGIVPSSRHVEAIVEMMLDATQNHEKELSAERLFSWQAALFPNGRSGMHAITVGAWRPIGSDPMQVVSGPIGHEHVHFEAPPAKKLNTEMNQFLTWFNHADVLLDPLLKAGIAHFWFVTLHPFEDGNGRIARAIADMALARADQSKLRFYSMSSQIEAERKDYYQHLETQQRGSLDITAWLDWFLSCLSRSLTHAESVLSAVLYKAKIWNWIHIQQALTLTQRQILILNKMLENFEGHLNSSKYAKLAKCSQDTALRDIRELVGHQIFVQNTSGGRSTSYRLVSSAEIDQLEIKKF